MFGLEEDYDWNLQMALMQSYNSNQQLEPLQKIDREDLKVNAFYNSQFQKQEIGLHKKQIISSSQNTPSEFQVSSINNQQIDNQTSEIQQIQKTDKYLKNKFYTRVFRGMGHFQNQLSLSGGYVIQDYDVVCQSFSCYKYTKFLEQNGLPNILRPIFEKGCDSYIYFPQNHQKLSSKLNLYATIHQLDYTAQQDNNKITIKGVNQKHQLYSYVQKLCRYLQKQCFGKLKKINQKLPLRSPVDFQKIQLRSPAAAAFDPGNTSTISKMLICPILLCTFKDPVITNDGHTYERRIIQQWLQSSNKSPLTGLPLTSMVLRSNQLLKRVVKELQNAQII